MMNPRYYHSQYSADRPQYPTPQPSISQSTRGVNTAGTSGYPFNYTSPTPELQSPGYLQQSSLSPSPPWDDIPNDYYGHDTPFTPSESEEDIVVSISTSFRPGNQPSPDTVLSSTDGVLFYVHRPTLVAACPEAFQNCTSSSISTDEFNSTVISVDVPSLQLNIILHALHGTSPAANSPDFDTLVAAVDRMPTYNITPRRFISPLRPMYDLLLAYAPLKPLELYALAAYHHIPTLAITASSHLLAFDLAKISDPMAERIGAVYLKKLLVLHHNRATSLRNIMLHPPHPHPPTRECGFENQKKLTRAWALASAYIAWDANPDLSTNTMMKTLSPLADHIECKMCTQALQDSIKTVVVQWASVKKCRKR